MATSIFRVAGSTLLLTLLAARAQTPMQDPRLATISDARIGSLLRGMAFDFTEDSTGESTVFAIQLDGHLVTARNQTTGLSLSACFYGGVEPLTANQWNRAHFSTRVDLHGDSCAALISDVKFGGGSTNQMIQDFVRRFCTDVAVFARFLASSPAAPDKRSTSPVTGMQSLDGLASPIGTMAWSQIGPFKKRMAPWVWPAGSVPGLLKIDSKVSLKYDPDQWIPIASQGDGQFAFSHSSGGGHALIVSEASAMPLDSVEDVALANAQSADPRAKVVFRNRSWVKGVASLFLKMEATVGTIPMVYWGKFYVGEGCAVQVITYTEKSQLPEYEHSFTDFLNGLTVVK